MTKRQWARRLWPWLALALLALVMIRKFEHSQVYHPTREMMANGTELGRPFQNVHFDAEDGTALHGWFYSGTNEAPGAGFVFLVCHGNGGNISHRLHLADALLSTGAGVFLFDYRGYGQSSGRPSEEGTYLDAQAAHQWLAEQGIKDPQIIALGESLGGGIASELARRREVGGLALVSTFTSIPDIGAKLFPWLPVRFLASIKYDTRSKLPNIEVPVLILHSRVDDLIPFEHAEKNYAAIRSRKLLIEIQGTHNEAVVDRERFVNAIKEFLQLMENAEEAPRTQG